MSDGDHTLEKLRIHDRLRLVELSLTELVTSNKQTVKVHSELIEHHDKMLMGTNSSPGLKTKVDRLEQSEKSRQSHIKAMWVVVTTLIGKFVYDLFHS